MSIKLMTEIKDLPGSKLEPVRKLVLLEYADRADPDGRNAWPSLGRIATVVGKTRRTVQRIVREFESAGVLEMVEPSRQGRPAKDGLTPRRGIHFRIRMDRVRDLYGDPEAERGDACVTPSEERGDAHVTPSEEKGRHPRHPFSSEGVTFGAKRGDTAVSTEPPLGTKNNPRASGGVEAPLATRTCEASPPARADGTAQDARQGAEAGSTDAVNAGFRSAVARIVKQDGPSAEVRGFLFPLIAWSDDGRQLVLLAPNESGVKEAKVRFSNRIARLAERDVQIRLTTLPRSRHEAEAKRVTELLGVGSRLR